MSTEKPVFTHEAEEIIFNTARSQVLSIVLGRGRAPKSFDVRQELGAWGDVSVLGTFVSFKKRGQLRSCMGWMNDGPPLSEALQSSAISAAREDPRFPPLAPSELADLTMEVWVLWGMKEIVETGEARLGTFKIGRHGLQIHYGGRRGLLLPGVAVEFKMTPLQFLEAVCQKAGLPKDAWRDPRTLLFTFEGLAIDHPFYDDAVATEVSQWRETRSSAESRVGTQNFDWNLGPPLAPSTAPPTTPQTLPSPPIRPAAVAGMFYPVGKEQSAMLDAFDASLPANVTKEKARAVMIPHAGWVYSGRLAYQVLAEVEIPSSVIIFAPKHRPEGASWAISPSRQWEFGGGRLANDIPLAEGLIRAVPRFKADEVSHRREHAIEVILPMIARLAPETKIVGALFGYGSEEELFKGAAQFAEFYKTLANPPLLIISSDMNHYENEKRTQILDQTALDALETLDPAILYRVVTANGITMCGVQAATFVLEALAKNGNLHSFRKVGHTTSAKTSGDFDHVVGYAGYVFQ